ncbi:MAG: OadG family protein [Lachnospiraceae bacterium]|nr:OadG family protein [Lachnospiraceae bacterium]
MGSLMLKALGDTVIGMGTVFVMLIFISLLIKQFVHIPSWQIKLKRFFGNFDKKQPQPKTREHVRPKRRDEIEAERDREQSEAMMADEQLIAVIMAAIVASEGGAVSADSLVVRSIRRVKRVR